MAAVCLYHAFLDLTACFPAAAVYMTSVQTSLLLVQRTEVGNGFALSALLMKFYSCAPRRLSPANVRSICSHT